MKNFKFFSLTVFLFFGTFFHSFSQIIQPGPEVKIVLDNSIKNIYIPFSGANVLQPRDVEINVNFIENATSNWTPAAEAAFEFAVGIWEQILTSEVTIEIDAQFTQLGTNILGSAGANQAIINFDADDPLYQADTWYAMALANKLEGEDLSPTMVDINANFNSDFTWYFGTDGNPGEDEIDFISIVLHEIGHGLGWFASTNANTTQGIYGILDSEGDGFPVIYDRFISNGTGQLLTDFDVGVSSVELGTYLLSDDLFWESTSDADGAKLYVPTTWEPGSSISHLDDDTFDDTPNALMTHAFGFAEAIHDPGALGIAILQDIGWDAELITGIEDDLIIHGFDYNCYSQAPFCDWGWIGELYEFPIIEVEIGDNVHYIWQFIDEYPTNQLNYPSFNWKLEILHNDGKYLLDECNYGCSEQSFGLWNLTLSDLPEGYHWSRNLNNQVRAKLSITGSDLTFYEYKEKLEILINYQPDPVDVEIINSGTDEDCGSLELSFYAPGAANYNILYRTESSPFWFVEQVSPGQFTFTFNNLDQGSDYEFKVEAYNDYGEVISETLYRESCELIVTTEPNPSIDIVKIKLIDGEPIDKVDVTKINNPNVKATKYGDGYSNELDIEVYSLPPGTYNVEVREINGKIANKLIVIF